LQVWSSEFKPTSHQKKKKKTYIFLPQAIFLTYE
jgi:hypothetical protein